MLHTILRLAAPTPQLCEQSSVHTGLLTPRRDVLCTDYSSAHLTFHKLYTRNRYNRLSSCFANLAFSITHVTFRGLIGNILPVADLSRLWMHRPWQPQATAMSLVPLPAEWHGNSDRRLRKILLPLRLRRTAAMPRCSGGRVASFSECGYW